MPEDIMGQRHDRTALILYGSETGNSQDVAEELGRVTERLHFVTRVSEMDLVAIVRLLISPSRVCPDTHSCAVERTLKIHCCYICNLNNRTG
jgi:sulfite reductase alpha subunit-like flavoprotein